MIRLTKFQFFFFFFVYQDNFFFFPWFLGIRRFDLKPGSTHPVTERQTRPGRYSGTTRPWFSGKGRGVGGSGGRGVTGDRRVIESRRVPFSYLSNVSQEGRTENSYKLLSDALRKPHVGRPRGGLPYRCLQRRPRARVSSGGPTPGPPALTDAPVVRTSAPLSHYLKLLDPSETVAGDTLIAGRLQSHPRSTLRAPSPEEKRSNRPSHVHPIRPQSVPRPAPREGSAHRRECLSLPPP